MNYEYNPELIQYISNEKRLDHGQFLEAARSLS